MFSVFSTFMEGVPLKPSVQGGCQTCVAWGPCADCDFFFSHVEKFRGRKRLGGFYLGIFPAWWVGVCLDIGTRVAKPRFEKTVGFIVYSIEYPGWKGPCCIRVLMSYACCGPIAQTVTG
jgi:hypothetical protein